ncbi:unnamed protein product [Microthlaspi erraticum]|uniref:Uncharacterized protein n=1 Tax=Microthlaspi erraticum TaxID=1685480 RepID=A0A6D2LLW9_9BRAS|nr:unnamed protein product [Microthlaspi erraticum]
MTGVNSFSGDKIDESKVKAPNMFERAREEFEAVLGSMHQHKSSSSRDFSEKMEFKSEKPVAEEGKKKPTMMKKAKEEIRSLFHLKEKPHRPHYLHSDSHGRSDSIDANTPVNAVKAPSVFGRAKEEIEAVIDSIHPKNKEIEPEKERAGFGCALGAGLEKICSPWGSRKKD